VPAAENVIDVGPVDRKTRPSISTVCTVSRKSQVTVPPTATRSTPGEKEKLSTTTVPVIGADTNVVVVTVATVVVGAGRGANVTTVDVTTVDATTVDATVDATVFEDRAVVGVDGCETIEVESGDDNSPGSVLVDDALLGSVLGELVLVKLEIAGEEVSLDPHPTIITTVATRITIATVRPRPLPTRSCLRLYSIPAIDAHCPTNGEERTGRTRDLGRPTWAV